MATTYAIPDGRVAMAATLWTGNGVNSRNIDNTVNGVSFQPDLVWLKSRSQAYAHRLVDSVRGGGKELSSNNTGAESSNDPNGSIYTLNSNGFQLYGSTDNTNVNTNGATLVAWQWKGGGTPVSNTAGSITSSVSANTTAGFSVVTYTGTGSTGTIGHGLGVAPSMVIFKNRSSAQSWRTYHSSVGVNSYLLLDSTAASTGDSGWTATSSTTFSVGGSGAQYNASTNTYVAYCFAPVAGYSAFGSYTGNASANGPFVYLGFRPRFVMFKNATGAGNSWVIFDTSRTPSNQDFLELKPESAGAESPAGSYAYFDFLSNGFKVRTTSTAENASGQTIIYMAFAENPFKYANAR